MSDYIPPELIPNILARLPVDDALRCTSVCKSWYDLITSYSFISLHRKLSTPNQESRLLVKFTTRESSRWKVHCKVYPVDEIAELECPSKCLFRILGSINGLLCLSYDVSSSMKILLWNPSLRKSLMLPELGCNRFDDVSVGFGFSQETNDYKIVRLLLSLRNHLIQVTIYELSTNSWRNVSVRKVSYCSFNYEPAVFLNGSLHWGVTVRHDDVNGSKFGKSIVSFDLKNENLGALSVPNRLENVASEFNVSVVKKSLCLIHFARAHYYTWVMNEYGVPDSWTMQFKIVKGHYSLVGPLNFRENGEIILTERQSMLRKDYLVSYDLTNDQVMNIGKYENKYMFGGKYENSYMFGVTTYMESLVLIKSTNQVL